MWKEDQGVVGKEEKKPGGKGSIHECRMIMKGVRRDQINSLHV